MKVVFIIFLFLHVEVFAIDINEAIDRAIKNNPSLKEKDFLLKSSKTSWIWT